MDLQTRIPISNGTSIPCVGFGTWKTPDEEAAKSVAEALRVGYRHIDTATAYGNEAGVGRAIAESGIAREEIFLTSKLWNPHQGYQSTLDAFARSLEMLRTDYLDLYLIHWPHDRKYFDNWEEMNIETWRAFEKLYDSLLQEVSMDVSTEIDTLEAMLSQDGLTHDFASDFGGKHSL